MGTNPNLDLRAVVATARSDSHQPQAAYIELLLEEAGFVTHNEGVCVPDDELVRCCRDLNPDLVVMVSNNGHGTTDCENTPRALKEGGIDPTIVIGGRPTVRETDVPAAIEMFYERGFDGVFVGSNAVADFLEFLERIRHAFGNMRPGSAPGTTRRWGSSPDADPLGI